MMNNLKHFIKTKLREYILEQNINKEDVYYHGSPYYFSVEDIKPNDIDIGIKKPILLKISPDLSQSELDDVIDIVSQTGIDGVIATNTVKVERGGLSGEPIRDKSTQVIRYLWEKSNKTLVIIGVGGIMTPEDALQKLEAGASLIQIYTGFIWEGPGLIKRINNLIIKRTNLI